jgi:osmotically-inducible protein OsmY
MNRGHPIDELESRVAAELSASHFPQLRLLKIDVERDVVTLRRQVSSWHERQVAVSAVIGVNGVRQVIDRMSVRL